MLKHSSGAVSLFQSLSIVIFSSKKLLNFTRKVRSAVPPIDLMDSLMDSKSRTLSRHKNFAPQSDMNKEMEDEKTLIIVKQFLSSQKEIGRDDVNDVKKANLSDKSSCSTSFSFVFIYSNCIHTQKTSLSDRTKGKKWNVKTNLQQFLKTTYATVRACDVGMRRTSSSLLSKLIKPFFILLLLCDESATRKHFPSSFICVC